MQIVLTVENCRFFGIKYESSGCWASGLSLARNSRVPPTNFGSVFGQFHIYSLSINYNPCGTGTYKSTLWRGIRISICVHTCRKYGLLPSPLNTTWLRSRLYLMATKCYKYNFLKPSWHEHLLPIPKLKINIIGMQQFHFVAS